MPKLTRSNQPVALWRELVRTGTWLYDGSAPMTVRVVRQNFDPQHEEQYDSDPPTLDSQGESYTVALGELREGWWFTEERATQLTEAAAIASAEALLSRIEWRSLQPPERLVSSQQE